jgi:hypothetical protein
MAITVLTLGILLFVAGVLWVFLPLLRPVAAADRVADYDRAARRDMLVAELRDAALDLTTGKLSQADYDAVKAAREAELAAVLRELQGGR